MTDPTHYAPLWLAPDDTFRDSEGCLFCTTRGTLVRTVLPAERVTVAPPAYEPKVGDRVATDLGYEATLLTDQPLQGRLAVRFHIPDGTDRYTTIDPAMIQGPA